MNRRQFVKTSAPLAVIPFFSNRLFASVPYLTTHEAQVLGGAMGGIADDRVFIVVQLSGGNDGLNTVLPLDQYTNLAAARSNILIPQNAALQLGNFATGLHPAMSGFKTMYDQQQLTVIQNVGYANPNYSHFRATDIYLTGADSNQVLDSGWLGRYLEYNYPGFPASYPNTAMPDPLSITIGSNVSSALNGYSINTSQSVPKSFSGALTQLLGYANATTPATPAGDEVQFIRSQQAYANQYANRIISAWNLGANTATYPTSGTALTNLAQQLKLVARLISGGCKTKVYWVSMGGFDTHDTQVDTSDTTQGIHATLLQELSDAVLAFQTDLKAQQLEHRVMGLTMSEFGRRIKSNASAGTDHGTAAPMFLFGKYANPTVLGANPQIPANATTNTNLAVSYDYREIYMSVLQNWFCLTTPEAQAVLLHNQMPANASIAPCIALAVKLVNFDVEKLLPNDANLSWSTTEEENLEKFDIMRSVNGVDFVKVAEVAANGHSHQLLNYTTQDLDLPIAQNQTFYYKLKMVELDGSFTFSPIKQINFVVETSFDFTILQNPTPNGVCNIIPLGSFGADVLFDLTITDILGRRIYYKETELTPNEKYNVDLSGAVSSGIYFITIKSGLGTQLKKWVVR